MSANELALRFSTTSAEDLIGVLPVREVKEALWQEVEDEVLDEVFQEHEFEMEAIAEQTNAANLLAQKFEVVAESLATAIKLALTQSPDEAMQTLKAVIDKNPGYGQDPVKG